MPNLSFFNRKNLILFSAICLAGQYSHAFDADYYATGSALADGNWAKIEVTETGMQFLSDATLRNLGFSSPENVNVYGYGGVMIPENLNTPDDLPLIPSIRTDGGIIFFGEASVGWEINSTGTSAFSHISHPYSDRAYYFVSDVNEQRRAPEKYSSQAAPSQTITTFTERLVHEQDLFMPMESGRLMLGEDFKTQSSRNFNFSMPDNTGDATVTVAFGCKTSSGTSSIVVSANNRQLPATTTDQMAFSSSKLIVTTTTTKTVENPGNSLNLSIKFNGSGSVSTAALNYIEVEYPRNLQINSGELYFYISPKEASEVVVSGASASTLLWDVTDPINPKEISTVKSGSSLSFISDAGYHEFVAFDTSRISRSVTPSWKIENQDLHSIEAPDMLVICPAEFLPAAQRLQAFHSQTDGLQLCILTPEQIYNEFSSGKPDVTAFRKLLKMWYDRAGGEVGKFPAYCTIMSRPTFDNKQITPQVKNSGYPRVPIWQSPTGETETTSYGTDDYIGMLGDVPGQFNIGSAEINVAVARMPFKTLTEANTVLDKLENYILNPDLGAWRNNVMVIADDQDSGVHLDQAEKVIAAMQSPAKGTEFQYEKLYLDAYPLEYSGVGATYPQAHNRLLNKWNEGLTFIDYIGHANASSWGHEYLLTWPNIISMSNPRLPFIYAATCNFMRWDANDVSGAEVLWLLPNSGAIGLICPSREVLISANGVLNISTAKYFFAQDEQGNYLSVGEIMRRGKNDSNTGTNKLRYALIGDPSLRLPFPNLNVIVDKVNGVELAEAKEAPILKARSTVTISGHVEDFYGNHSDDFNGIAEITLYDAEKVITTNGNGSDGVQSVYNDRKTRLFVGRTTVKDGKWETTFTMPSEIENNYSPALISLYAFSEDGQEGNGSSDKIYAYGYDEDAPDDFEGPKMIEFYLNNPSFVSGNQVSPSPTLVAKFFDESGISVSEAGIGHNISLTLDGTTFYDDVALYYRPDENESGTGSLTYSLGEVSQGKHTLELTVWDNANNSTTASLEFSISALWKPAIEMLTTDVNPAVSSVNFIVATDGSTSSMECAIEIFDIWGRKVWRDTAPSLTSASTRTSMGWDLCDFGGSRVPAGIYLYKATVKTDSGATVTKTKKLIVK
ncbi:MAG: type IX secretion system sortase PorU [Muribaculaceae bacterium]|nr:type IX secretion system sortase PorU [Muribaculaceae bacterium]